MVLSLNACTQNGAQPARPTDDLQRLRVPGGLYAQPSAFAPAIDVPATGYLAALARRAGHPWPSLNAQAASSPAVAAFVDSHPAWGRWLLAQAGHAASASEVRAVLALSGPDGLLAEQGMQQDQAARFAVTQAVLELAPVRAALSASQRHAMAHSLRAAAPPENPYQGCIRARLAKEIGESIAFRLATPTTVPDSTTIEGRLDFVGIGCLSVDRELSVSETFRREALDSIGNSLSAVQDPQDIDELGLAWLDLGGAPARVATVLDAQVKHVGPDGLVRLAAQPSGSLDSTYAVLRIRVALQGEPDDPEAAAAVQTLVTSGRLRTPLELLEAAAVLQEAGHPDAALATQAAGQVHGSVPSQVTAANLPTWARAADLLAVLGQPPARASVDPGGASARETRYLTWLVLAHLDAVDGTGTLDRYRAVLTAIPQVLATEGERLSTAELVAALRAWAVVGTGSALDLPSVRSLVASRLGCPGWPEIFSTAAGSTDCDLESTMTLLEGVPGTKELMASGGHS